MEWLTACYRIHYSSVYTHTRTHTWCPIEEAKQAHIFIPKTTNPQASWRTNTSVDISLVVRIMVRWDLFATADKTSQPMSVSTQRVCDLDMELDTKSQEDPPNSTIAITERRRQGGRDPARGRGFLPTRSIPTSATAGQGGAWEVESDHEQLSQGMERVERDGNRPHPFTLESGQNKAYKPAYKAQRPHMSGKEWGNTTYKCGYSRHQANDGNHPHKIQG